MQIGRMSSTPILGYRKLRKGRRSIPGQLYLTTTITRKRLPRFLDPELAQAVASSLSTADLWLPSRCLCWVLMPDHFHALIELGEGADLSTTMRRVKGVTARITNQTSARHGPLWEKGFHDRALRKDDEIETVARYIIANPVRKGLVKDPIDYPFWDAWFLSNAGEHRS
jgi:putative transposase